LRYRKKASVKRIRWIPEMRVSFLLPGVAVLVLLAGGADAADDSVKEKVSLSARRVMVRAVYPKSKTPRRWRGNRISSCSGN
jgi:hypothetical protein